MRSGRMSHFHLLHFFSRNFHFELFEILQTQLLSFVQELIAFRMGAKFVDGLDLLLLNEFIRMSRSSTREEELREREDLLSVYPMPIIRVI